MSWLLACLTQFERRKGQLCALGPTVWVVLYWSSAFGQQRDILHARPPKRRRQTGTDADAWHRAHGTGNGTGPGADAGTRAHGHAGTRAHGHTETQRHRHRCKRRRCRHRRKRRTKAQGKSEKGKVLPRGLGGTLRYSFPPNASVQWQPGDLAIHTEKWFLGAGFLGAPPISLRKGQAQMIAMREEVQTQTRASCNGQHAKTPRSQKYVHLINNPPP